MNKKGISMVALVITIIVLIILTGAVVMTGVNAPTNASSAVAAYNKAVIQDAVTIYIMNYISADTSKTVMDAVNTFLAEDNEFTADANTGSKEITVAPTGFGLTLTDVTGYKINANGLISNNVTN